MSRFTTSGTEPLTQTVSLGACECPGAPHTEDSAEVYTTLGWDDLVDIGSASSEGAARRVLVTRALASWTLAEADADGRVRPVPISEATVRLLSADTIDAITEAVNAAFERSRAPLPNASGEGSPPSPPETATSTPTIPPTGRHTS